MLQNEVDEWGTKFGILDIDLLGYYKSDNLMELRKQAEVVEHNFRQAIKKSGVKLDEYNTVEDFLKIN
jgi:hypothetical protein